MVPKYRRRVLGGRGAVGLNELLDEIAAEHAWEVVARQVTPDRVRVFVRVRPTDPPAEVAGQLKGRRCRVLLAARHGKIANTRRDFHHNTARALVERDDVIVVEDLKIANMLRRAKPRPDPGIPGSFLPNGAAAKTGLNRCISDAGWGAFVAILRAKAEEAGRKVLDVDPRHTSDRCRRCGYSDEANRVNQAVFRCQACGYQAHADEHAAANILRAGLALLAAGQAA